MTRLDDVELERYARQILLIGGRGQHILKGASVLIIGLGGLGSPAALYLAAAGVGKLGLMDSERVELSNLHRQILHATPDLNRPKIESATERLRALNPDIELVAYPERLTSENALEILREYDVIVDGSDNFPTRYLVNDACVLLRKPNVHGSVLGFEGQVTVFTPGGPCYRCVYENPPPTGTIASCAEAGIFPTAAGLVGLIQANEALKLLLGGEPSLKGRLLLIDTRSLLFSEIALRRNPDCAVCGEHPTITELIDYEEFCGRR
jgi:adenylyltransferase/sulfurtransferase